MAGLSSRFFKSGYTQPKYMLEAHGETLFEHSVKSFINYFEKESFLFIVRDVFDTPEFVRNKATKLGIKDFKIKVLEDETRGQAETVFMGVKDLITSEPMTVFNIDTFRPNFIYPENMASWDGYLEVFEGEGENWSFTRPLNENTTQVIETAEKRAISNLCCTGLYYFKTISQFLDAYFNYLDLPVSQWDKGELYIAPLYNFLIGKNEKIHYNLISRDSVIFCGVPDEYEDFKVMNVKYK